LELAHHPDKSTDPNAIEESKRLNDAKDRAIGMVRRQHELEEHLKYLKHHTSEELKSPSGDDLRQGVYRMVGNLQHSTGKYRPNPEIGGYYRLVRKLEDDRERARSDRDKAKQERNDAVAKANELERENDKALSEIEELKGKRDEDVSKINELTHERDSALSKIAELTHERDSALSKIAELTHERDSALSKIEELMHERDSASSKITELMHEEPINQPGQREVGDGITNTLEDTCIPNAKKRKHTKVFVNQEENESFKETVSQFVQSSFRVSQEARCFLSAQQILEMFTGNGHHVVSKNLFFKEIVKQLKNHFPSVCSKRVNGHTIYHGLASSFP